jgi:CRP/FNR family transcriptional regulator, cyclic AMP receptor protein
VATVASSHPGAPLLELDPDLAAGVAPEDLDAARRACRGGLVHVRRGRWELPIGAGERDDRFGLVIVDGLVCREITLRDHHMLELLGPHDVLQLPVLTGRPRLGNPIKITAATDATLLVLGDLFLRASTRWPSLLATFLRRIEAQRERLAVQGLITHVARADHRILLALWHLADRWGERTDDGTMLPLPLTHDLIGHLVAARRSTVTLAVSALEADRYLRRLDHGAWFLTAAGEERVAAIARSTNETRVLGETIMLRKLTSDARSEAEAVRAEAVQLRARKRAVIGRGSPG